MRSFARIVFVFLAGLSAIAPYKTMASNVSTDKAEVKSTCPRLDQVSATFTQGGQPLGGTESGGWGPAKAFLESAGDQQAVKYVSASATKNEVTCKYYGNEEKTSFLTTKKTYPSNYLCTISSSGEGTYKCVKKK
jgi:hypothetical protein